MVKYKHAIDAMNDLGITYKSAIPQSLGDQWVFYDCQNIPESLPRYASLREMNNRDYEDSGITPQQEVKP